MRHILSQRNYENVFFFLFFKLRNENIAFAKKGQSKGEGPVCMYIYILGGVCVCVCPRGGVRLCRIKGKAN